MQRILIVAMLTMAFATSATAQTCVGNPVAVQILGSGGPGFLKDRANTGYLVWAGTQAKVLVDAGGGTYVRYGQAGAKFSDLSIILVSHLHPDHVGDLPSIIWSGRNRRTEPLPVVGPSGDTTAPSFSIFFSRLFDPKSGAFEVLSSVIDTGPGTKFVPSVIDVTKREPSTVFDRDGINVTALGVQHGIPSLAYRVETRGRSVVFGSDQDGSNPRFMGFAKGASLLIMHPRVNNPNIATANVIGRIAGETNPGRLVLSHIGDIDLDAAVADVRRNYIGPLTVGADLQCFQL